VNRLGLLGVLITTVAAVVFIGGSGATTSAAGLGNIFVAPNGNDAGVSCVRNSSRVAFPGTRTNVCRTLKKAKSLALPGDLIIVGNGSYNANQQVCRGTSSTCSTSATNDVGPAITLRSESQHGAVIHGGLYLGGGTSAGAIPSYVTIDGIDVQGWVGMYGLDTQPKAKYITLKNMHIWDITTGNSNPLGVVINIYDGHATNVVWDHLEIGPVCCRNDGIGGASNLGLGHNSVIQNWTIQNSQIHDLYDDCSLVRANMVTLYGACSGSNPGLLHIDVAQIAGGYSNFKFLNNRAYAFNTAGAAAAQGLFIHCGDFINETLDINCVNTEIRGNTFVSGTGTNNAVLALGNEFGGSVGVDGKINIVNNTFIGLNGDPGASIDIADVAPTAQPTITGNVGYTGWLRKSGSFCVVPIAAKDGGGNNGHTNFTGNYFSNGDCAN
jgi:hypothetical protein